MESIKSEVAFNILIPTDLDNLRLRYKETLMTEEGIPDLEVIYPSPEIYALDKNFFTLLYNSQKVSFKPRWQQRPDYVSYDYYGTTIYWPVILYINRKDSIEDFQNIDYIYVPSEDYIYRLASDRVIDTEDLNVVEELSTKISYFTAYPLDNAERKKIEAANSLSDSAFYGYTGTPYLVSDPSNPLCSPCPTFEDQVWTVDGGVY